MIETKKGVEPANEYFAGVVSFRKEGEVWREYPALPTGNHYEFKELHRDNEYLYLFDESRRNDERSPMYLRIPIVGGSVQWSYANPLVWSDIYIVEPRHSRKD